MRPPAPALEPLSKIATAMPRSRPETASPPLCSPRPVEALSDAQQKPERAEEATGVAKPVSALAIEPP